MGKYSSLPLSLPHSLFLSLPPSSSFLFTKKEK
jgi:hypothetical protein